MRHVGSIRVPFRGKERRDLQIIFPLNVPPPQKKMECLLSKLVFEGPVIYLEWMLKGKGLGN